MDKVILLSKHITNIKVISKVEGRWEKGKYIADEEKEKIIKGVYMPISSDTLKYYPQGEITLKDIELFTKEKLKEGDIAILRNEEFKIIEITDFDYLADIKSYILKRSTKDD
mgnify:FL=1